MPRIVKLPSFPAGKKLNTDMIRKAVVSASNDDDDDPWSWPSPRPTPGKPRPPYIPKPQKKGAKKKGNKYLSA